MVNLVGWNMQDGAIFVDPDELRGNHVGTYLMDRIVQWAQQWPDAEVAAITLNPKQGGGLAGMRRDRFYDQFNIKFGPPSSNGYRSSISMRVAGLARNSSWRDNVFIHRVPIVLTDFAEAARSAKYDFDQLQFKYEKLDEGWQRIMRCPFGWAIVLGWAKWKLQILGVILGGIALVTKFW